MTAFVDFNNKHNFSEVDEIIKGLDSNAKIKKLKTNVNSPRGRTGTVTERANVFTSKSPHRASMRNES